MTQIKKMHRMSDGAQIYPQTHTKAVIDDSGYTAESRLQAMQDEINQAQLTVGAVPSDLTPTKGSNNWVTSGGIFNALDKICFVETIEPGFFFVDSNNNIGALFDNDGFHAINMLEFNFIENG